MVKDRKGREELRELLFSRIQWLMFYRAVVVTVLLGATVLVQIKEPDFFRYTSPNYFYILISVTYFLTLVYALFLPRIRRLKVFAYGQIFEDLLFVTLFIYVTGGIESIFSWVYLLAIFAAGTILYRRGGIIIALASTIFYGTLLGLEFYQVIPPLGSRFSMSGGYNSTYVIYLITVNTLAFYLVAVLSAYLSEQVRRKEEELKEHLVDYGQLERLYKHIVQNVNSGLITIDEAGRITSFNRMAEEISGYKLEEIYQEEIGPLFPGFLDWPRSPGGSADKKWDQIRFARWETEFQRKDGARLTLGFSVSPLKDSTGREIGSILIFQDLTKLREMEEDLRRADRLAAIGSMAAGMAHEIRNPLASISGSIEILREELAGSSQYQELMEIILREVGRLNSLIADFLLFARPASSGQEIIHLNAAVEEILKMFANSPDCGPEIRFVTRFQDDLFIPGDTQQIRQVFWNLFINAAQAMPSGGELCVEFRKTQSLLPLTEESAQGEISVSDTGIGIAEKAIGKIFDPFFTTKEKGTGLGLSIVHSIVDSYKGKITVQSHLGRGTVFTIFLPVVPPPA